MPRLGSLPDEEKTAISSFQVWKPADLAQKWIYQCWGLCYESVLELDLQANTDSNVTRTSLELIRNREIRKGSDTVAIEKIT